MQCSAPIAVEIRRRARVDRMGVTQDEGAEIVVEMARRAIGVFRQLIEHPPGEETIGKHEELPAE